MVCTTAFTVGATLSWSRVAVNRMVFGALVVVQMLLMNEYLAVFLEVRSPSRTTYPAAACYCYTRYLVMFVAFFYLGVRVCVSLAASNKR